MIDLELAIQLKQVGLRWTPAKRDNFTIPGSGLAEDVFTLSDLTTMVEPVKGQFTVTFHGSVEWALDHILLADALWLPSETQLREAVQLRLGGEAPLLALRWSAAGYECAILHLGHEHRFVGATAEAAYGATLLFLLEEEQRRTGQARAA